MSMNKMILVYAILVGYFLIFFILFFFLWIKERRIRDTSTKQIQGTVVDYKRWVAIRPPVVEYIVNNAVYRRLLVYSTTVSGSFTTNYPTDKDELRQYLLSITVLTNFNALPYQLMELFPVGSKMTVYYNPKDPKISFVERYAGLISFFRWGWMITGMIIILINVVFWMIWL